MATSNIILPNHPLSLSRALAFALPVTPQSQIVSFAVGVDDVSLNVNRAHHYSRTVFQ
jgi:hypothetical protein